LLNLSSEWWVSAQQYVHDDPAAPDVALGVVVSLQHLRCHVTGGADHFLQNMVRLALAGKSKVNQFQDILIEWFLRQEEKVIRLYVVINYTMAFTSLGVMAVGAVTMCLL